MALKARLIRNCREHQIAAHSNSALVPWSVLALAVRASFATRADTVAAAGAGGYLVETANLTAADALRPDLLCGPLGQTIIPAPYGASVTLPRQTGTATAFWQSIETSTVAESDQTFGQIAFVPRTVGAYTEMSRLLRLQSNARPNYRARSHASIGASHRQKSAFREWRSRANEWVEHHDRRADIQRCIDHGGDDYRRASFTGRCRR